MNKWQRVVLATGLCAFGVVGLVPPWMAKTTLGARLLKQHAIGHYFIGTPPAAEYAHYIVTVYSIDRDRLGILWTIIVVVTSGTLLLLRNAPARADERVSGDISSTAPAAPAPAAPPAVIDRDFAGEERIDAPALGRTFQPNAHFRPLVRGMRSLTENKIMSVGIVLAMVYMALTTPLEPWSEFVGRVGFSVLFPGAIWGAVGIGIHRFAKGERPFK